MKFDGLTIILAEYLGSKLKRVKLLFPIYVRRLFDRTEFVIWSCTSMSIYYYFKTTCYYCFYKRGNSIRFQWSRECSEKPKRRKRTAVRRRQQKRPRRRRRRPSPTFPPITPTVAHSFELHGFSHDLTTTTLYDFIMIRASFTVPHGVTIYTLLSYSLFTPGK